MVRIHFPPAKSPVRNLMPTISAQPAEVADPPVPGCLGYPGGTRRHRRLIRDRSVPRDPGGMRGGVKSRAAVAQE